MQHEAWYLLVIWLISTEVESVMAAWERTCTPFTKSFGPHPRGICGRRIDETLSLLCMGDYYQSPSYYRRKRETLTEAYVELCVNIYSGILKARSLELDIAYNNDLYHGRTNGISRARYVPQSTGLSNVPRTGLFTTVESMNEMMKTVGGGCKNFLKLCKVKYYNFCLFHSIQRNLVAQTGDPTGTGKGGESVYGLLYGEQAKYFDAEVSPRIKHKNVGTVSMVNNGNSRHGSQFFITLGEDLDYLDNVHTVFGEVAEGLDVLMKINEAYCDKEHRPYKDIRIYHTVILDDPYDDPTGLDVPDKSPEPTKEQLDSGRIGAEEDINDFEGMTEAEIQEIIEEREAKANAQILTMVGDIPEEDIAPPENVLFVCKLNPVTTDEDLEIIFSRFGHIKSCEVIRDQKTKESLQYAFIEFEKPEECENAYFKMDNVLIDDRRIHVDFSQSVAKYKWKGKGRGVEILKEDKKDDFSSKFTIKDNTRKDDRYSLVFEEEEVRKDSKKKKKKKHKTKHDSDSDSEQGKEKKSKHKKHKPERSRSPKEDKERYRKHSPIQSSYRDRSQRSRSPDHRNRSQRSRSPEYTDKRRRSPPSEYRDKHRRSSSPEYREKRKRRSPSPEYRDKRRKSPSPEYRDKYQYRERDRQRDYEKSKYRDSEKYKDRRNR